MSVAHILGATGICKGTVRSSQLTGEGVKTGEVNTAVN